MAYSKTTWVDNEAPYLNANNLNKIETGIDNNDAQIVENTAQLEQNTIDIADNRTDIDINSDNILGLSVGEVYQGTWTPEAGTEYPASPEGGWSYYIQFLDDDGYTFTTGDLTGRIANNSDKIIYNGTSWSMIDNTNEQLGYYLVDDIESMLALSPLQGALCQVYGYYEANDGGGGTFNYDVSYTGTNNGGTIFNGWVRQFNNPINIKWFGAKGDGITDDTASIQSAIDTLETTGGAIYIPEGEFLLSSTLNVYHDNISILGSGEASILVRTGDYGDTILVTEETHTTWIRGFEASNFVIRTDDYITQGAHIHIDGLLGGTITKITAYDGHQGIHLAAAGGINIDNCYINFNDITTSESRYVLIEGSTNPGTNPHSGDVFFTNFNGRGGTTSQCEIGVDISVCDGIFFSNSHIGNCTIGNVLIDGDTDIKCTGVLFSNCWLDIGEGFGARISGTNTNGVKGNHYFADCTFLGGGNNTSGVQIYSSAMNNIIIRGCNIHGYNNDGITIGDDFPYRTIIESNRIMDNGLVAGSGIYLGGDCQARIVSNEIQGSTHAAAISIVGDKVGCVIDNNEVLGNATSMSAITGSLNSQRGNHGFNPYGDLELVTIGASPFTYTNLWGFDIVAWIDGVDNVARDGLNMPGFVSGEVMLGKGDTVTITYTGTPSMRTWGL